GRGHRDVLDRPRVERGGRAGWGVGGGLRAAGRRPRTLGELRGAADPAVREGAPLPVRGPARRAGDVAGPLWRIRAARARRGRGGGDAARPGTGPGLRPLLVPVRRGGRAVHPRGVTPKTRGEGADPLNCRSTETGAQSHGPPDPGGGTWRPSPAPEVSTCLHA